MKTSSTSLPPFRRTLLILSLLPVIALAAHANPPGPRVARSARAAKGAAASIIYSTPYLRANPHTKDYHIPINIESQPGATLCGGELKIEISFLAASFYPQSVTRGKIVANTVSGRTRTVAISLGGTTPVDNGVLTELVGEVLLGESESTPLTLAAVRCDGVKVTDSIRSGDMSLTEGYCETGGDRLLEYRAGFGITKIVPNPSGGAVSIGVRTVELDETVLEIYSAYGARIFQQSWTPTSTEELDEIKEIALPREIPNGVYEVVLRSPARRDVQTLIIAK